MQESKALWRSWLARRPVTAEVAGSSPVRVAHSDGPFVFRGPFVYDMAPRMPCGSVAQLVERTTENREVTGSTPVGATRMIVTVIPETLA